MVGSKQFTKYEEYYKPLRRAKVSEVADIVWVKNLRM